ncbi:SPFH domain-containing protein [Mycoplasmopsis cynos]|nr:SPFH domain-containing protein [Mycoplasmopsis cynos]
MHGIKVYRVEIKNILPPLDIQNAMEKQMRAEREKEQIFLTLKGKKQLQF